MGTARRNRLTETKQKTTGTAKVNGKRQEFWTAFSTCPDLERERWIKDADALPEPGERRVEEMQQRDEGDQVRRDVGDQWDGEGRAVRRRLDDVPLRTEMAQKRSS